MEQKTKGDAAYACVVIKRLIWAAVFCTVTVTGFHEETVFHNIIMSAATMLFTARFIQALRNRKRSDTAGHALNAMFLVMFAASYYYYLKGDGLPFIIALQCIFCLI